MCSSDLELFVDGYGRLRESCAVQTRHCVERGVAGVGVVDVQRVVGENKLLWIAARIHLVKSRAEENRRNRAAERGERRLCHSFLFVALAREEAVNQNAVVGERGDERLVRFIALCLLFPVAQNRDRANDEYDGNRQTDYGKPSATILQWAADKVVIYVVNDYEHFRDLAGCAVAVGHKLFGGQIVFFARRENNRTVYKPIIRAIIVVAAAGFYGDDEVEPVKLDILVGIVFDFAAPFVSTAVSYDAYLFAHYDGRFGRRD